MNKKQVSDWWSGSVIIGKEDKHEEQMWQEIRNNWDVIMMDATVKYVRSVVRRT